jgi:subfamily B ATP-binding cassette protein HlyB/CyaB
LVWALGSCCALAGKPFDPQLLVRDIAPPFTAATLVAAARSLGFFANAVDAQPSEFSGSAGHAILLLHASEGEPALGLLIQVADDQITWIPAGSNEPLVQHIDTFRARYSGQLVHVKREAEAANDPDQEPGHAFGFRWFVPELLKHRGVWRDVLAASLVLQLLALGLPLFTQAIIDKVVVHQTESTLIAIAVGMVIFVVATAVLTWVRQYLVLHTGNRVDAVLAATVFDHLFKLPPRYFQHRPTGVIAARLHGVETIREFVSSAAVTLVLDIPFLLIAVAVMFFYSVPLTLIVLGILAVVTLISVLVAPVFQTRLNEQFGSVPATRPSSPKTSRASRRSRACSSSRS